MSHGFKINPYNPCVVNKMVNRHQATVVWWVDNLKFSYEDPKVINYIVGWLREKYEYPNIGVMSPTRGKENEFLGMKLDFSQPGYVRVVMAKFIMSMVKDFKKWQYPNIKKVSSPVAPHLFQV